MIQPELEKHRQQDHGQIGNVWAAGHDAKQASKQENVHDHQPEEENFINEQMRAAV